MFEKDTVFILGAGASWHYGYPTGEFLVHRMKWLLDRLASYLEISIRDVRCRSETDPHPLIIREKFTNDNHTNPHRLEKIYEDAIASIRGFIKGLDAVDPPVIDYYLPHLKEEKELGKLAIAWVLMDCEAHTKLHKYNINRTPRVLDALISSSVEERIAEQRLVANSRDRWCRFITHHLMLGCHSADELLTNKVTFVTFNYDQSLERALYAGLDHFPATLTSSEIDKFITSKRFIHLYGKLDIDYKSPDVLDISLYRDHPATRREMKVPDVPWKIWREAWQKLLDDVYNASKTLNTIDGPNKLLNDKEFELASAAINTAQRIYVLGYGFDEKNSERLSLPSLLRPHHDKMRRVYFTNYGDINQVNKKASRLFFEQPKAFLDSKIIEKDLRPNRGAIDCYYEKSVRNVYDALAIDFDSFDAKFPNDIEFASI